MLSYNENYNPPALNFRPPSYGSALLVHNHGASYHDHKKAVLLTKDEELTVRLKPLVLKSVVPRWNTKG